MTTAVVFPGQGSQSIGMLANLASEFSIVKETFQEASEALSYDLWALVSQGVAEDLNLTQRTQPAMLAAGIAVYRCYQQLNGPLPLVGAGHSLGEITALVAAKAFDFKQAIALTEFRGRVMQAAVPAPLGAMAAILMLDDSAVIEACREAAQGNVVEAVNFNCPGQVVIAGHAEAVERAIDICKAKGAKRALKLPVSVPAHSSLMAGAGQELAQELAKIHIARPEFRVCALNGLWHDEPAAIASQLVQQLAAPVRWTDTMHRLKSLGVTRIIECGPGKVLTGLNKKIFAADDMTVMAIDDPSSLAAATQATANT
jgi:[acyl-carrier-protein] S-malonyltransferase